MLEWIRQVFESGQAGAAMLPAALLLGLITAVMTIGCGCKAAILAAIVGYAGSRQQRRLRDNLLICVCFILGVTVSLGLLGALLGSVGKLGRYGMVIAGFITVVFGLGTLGLIPIKLPSFEMKVQKRSRGLIGGAVFGIAMGCASAGVVISCCGPLFAIVMGMTTAQGQILWGVLVMLCFGIGFSLPAAALMLGVGMGRWTRVAEKASGPIRIVGGVMLIGVGFWLMLSQ